MSRDKVLERVGAKADQLRQSYPNAETLLRESMQEASVWVMPYVMQGKTPTPWQLEKLATQLLAIVVASEK